MVKVFTFFIFFGVFGVWASDCRVIVTRSDCSGVQTIERLESYPKGSLIYCTPHEDHLRPPEFRISENVVTGCGDVCQKLDPTVFSGLFFGFLVLESGLEEPKRCFIPIQELNPNEYKKYIADLISVRFTTKGSSNPVPNQEVLGLESLCWNLGRGIPKCPPKKRLSPNGRRLKFFELLYGES